MGVVEGLYSVIWYTLLDGMLDYLNEQKSQLTHLHSLPTWHETTVYSRRSDKVLDTTEKYTLTIVYSDSERAIVSRENGKRAYQTLES